MAVFTRVNGNAQNVVNVGPNSPISSEALSVDVPISTGIGKPIQAFAVNLQQDLGTSLGTGEAVEAILRTIGSVSTLLAYQISDNATGVNANSVLSVVIEASQWTAADLQANIQAIGSVVQYNPNVTINCGLAIVTEPGLALIG